MLNCNMMTRLLHCVSLEVRNMLTYDGLNEVDTFLDAFEKEVHEKKCFQALDWDYALHLQDGGVRIRETLMIGVNVGG